MSAPAARELERTARNLVTRQLGASVRRVEVLPGGLGLRRFARVFLDDPARASLVVRFEAPEDPRGRPAGIPPEPPLEPIRALLEAQGLPVPARYGGDDAQGIALLEDVGPLSLRDALESAGPAERSALYREACGLVSQIQRVPDPGGGVAAFARRLDAAHFAYKAELFAEWSLALRGRAASAEERACVAEAFARIARLACAAPQRLAHRDLQSANLHVRRERPPGRRLVLIDLQGALLAPPEYDLVCLLCDSYVRLPAAEIEAHCDWVRPRLPDAPDPETFAARFDLLTLTRKCKDHARFVYAFRERGDAHYLRYLPNTLAHLRRAARRAARRDSGFAGLAELILSLPETPCEA